MSPAALLAPADLQTPDQALAEALDAAALTPADPATRRTLAHAYRAAGQEIEARVEECAAEALAAGMPLVLFNLGCAYHQAGYKTAAAHWYRVALMVEPDMAVAHQNLACILFDQGHKRQALEHRGRAYRKQCVYIARAPAERRRILVLAASGYGNVPMKWLVPQQTNTCIMWFLEYAKPETIVPVPPYDVVFNAIGDADMDGPSFATACAFMQASALPVLNNPHCVARTRRDRLPGLLDGIPGVHTAPVLRVTRLADAAAAWTQHGMAFPLLLRPAGSHGGDGLHWLDTPQALEAINPEDAEAWYVSPFRDCRSPDGYWRKYRMIFVNRQPYPYHLAISPQWLVHYATADMLGDPGKCREEQRFLADPEAVLGSSGMAAIRTIGQRLDLDYAGIDFTILPDGSLLVFEANATMLVHDEKQPEYAYKNPYVHRIVDAFEARMTQVAPESHPATQETNPSS